MVTTELQTSVRTASLPRRSAAVTVLMPAVTALLLGLWGLNRPGRWGGEAATWSAARRSSAELWQLLGHSDAVHGPYYLLMHGLLALRADELMLRAPSVAAMTLAAALVSAIGARLAGPLVGVTAGMLFAVVPVVSFYAQEGLPYALVTAGAAAATYFLVRGCEEEAVRWWCWYTVAVAVTGLLHLSALLVLAAHAVTLLVARGTAGLWLRWAMSAAFASAAVAPVMWVTRGQLEGVSWLATPGWSAVTGLVQVFAGPSGWVAFPTLLFAGGALVAQRRSGTGTQFPGLTVPVLALPLLLLPPVILVAVSQLRPVYAEQYVLYALPGLTLLVAAGIERLADAVTPWGAAVPLTGAFLVALTFAGQLDAHRQLRSVESRVDDQRHHETRPAVGPSR